MCPPYDVNRTLCLLNCVCCPFNSTRFELISDLKIFKGGV